MFVGEETSMTITSTGTSAIYSAALNPPQGSPAQPKTQQTTQDHVDLSPQAKAATDVDHDGDSH